VNRTEQEIHSQPEMWARAFGLTERARELLVAPGENVLAIGCGTSAYMAESYARLREAAGAGPTDAAYASEISPLRRFDRLVAISRSGTTTEILEALRGNRAAGQRGLAARTVGVTAVTGLDIDELVDEQLVLDFADESSVVQTRFPTTLLALVRAALGEDTDAMLAACREAVEQPLPADPARFDHFVFLGSGWTVGLADEAALKIREAAQAWSESYPAMEYRHGPIAVAGDRRHVAAGPAGSTGTGAAPRRHPGAGPRSRPGPPTRVDAIGHPRSGSVSPSIVGSPGRNDRHSRALPGPRPHRGRGLPAPSAPSIAPAGRGGRRGPAGMHREVTCLGSGAPAGLTPSPILIDYARILDLSITPRQDLWL
jgi:glucosamine--fructose-6-phosphate aminotransferase (isomerizing)